MKKPWWENPFKVIGAYLIFTSLISLGVWAHNSSLPKNNLLDPNLDWPIPKERAIKIMRFHGVQFLKIETWSGIPEIYIKRDGVWIQVDEYNRYPGATPLCDTDADCHELDHLLGREDHGGEYFGHHYSPEGEKGD